MTFITGSITNANPGPALYAVIETAALAIGWTLEDTVVIGGNTHKVLKSAAAGNAQGLDWFLDLNYPTTGTTGGFRAAPFEGYTAASDVGLRGPFAGASSTTIDATTYSRYGATASALETNWINSASYTGISLSLTTSAFTYWVSITRNRVIIMTTNNTTKVLYTGFFTPTTAHATEAGAALFPLVQLGLSDQGLSQATTLTSTSFAATRVPKATSGLNWGNHGLTQANYGVLEGTVGGAASPFTGRFAGSPLQVIFGTGTTGAGYTNENRVGTVDDVALFASSGSVVRGDTVTVGSDTWYAFTNNNAHCLFIRGV